MTNRIIDFNDEKRRTSVGLSGLGRQIYRRTAQKGYDFTLMVCGEQGLGKTTLLETLFDTTSTESTLNTSTLVACSQPLRAVDEDEGHAVATSPLASDTTPRVHVRPTTMRIRDHGINLNLTILDTPGYGAADDNSRDYEPLEEYIDAAFRSYLQDESRADRKDTVDRRVHCLLYFISPNARGLRPLDRTTLKHLHTKVNVVPVIAKADTLSTAEVAELKARVLQDLDAAGIDVFRPGEVGDDADDAGLSADVARMVAAIPFAVIGSTDVHKVGGKEIRGRKYGWGIADVDNEAHCDFALLHKMLIETHLHDLKGLTEEVVYERFRKTILERNAGVDSTTFQNEKMKRNLESQARALEDKLRELEEERKRYEAASHA
eukprot:m.320750 g.320750  ORF g.320750 m.320750 type:complete len:377 (-) comp20326_c0_seq4:2095-3225(-)